MKSVKYLGYEIQNYNAYAQGARMWHYPCNSTITKLKELGARHIIWGNGDFIAL